MIGSSPYMQIALDAALLPFWVWLAFGVGVLGIVLAKSVR